VDGGNSTAVGAPDVSIPGRVMPFDLSGRVALVTGGSRGLGRAMCHELARAGADIVIASRQQPACDEVAAEIRQLGRRALARACHVGRWDQLDGLVADAYQEFGHVDILVNNAGKSPLYRHLTDIDERHFDSVIGLNLKGPFRLSTLIATRMAAGSGGSVINISSTAADHASPRALPYAAAKLGLHALTAGLAAAFAPKVRVNTIVPGAMRTDVSKAWTDQVWSESAAGAMLRRVGDPAEITGAVLYLASDASSFTTNARINVDGGKF
jgi:NAD(P)-dependent dehydrogenase (short-subunit alcohol dehydrogenase family)